MQKRELLRGYEREALELAAHAEDKGFRWHMALLLPRLSLTASQRAAAVHILREYLNEGSSIVKTWAIEGLADLARKDRRLLRRVRKQLSGL